MKKQSINISANILSFHVDWLEVYATFHDMEYFEEQIQIIKNDPFSFNKGSFEFEEYICIYDTYARNYEYKITFKKNDVSCFAFYKGVQVSERITSKNYFCVYGKAFRILSYENILDFLDTHLELSTIRRIDLAINVTKDIKILLQEFKELKQTGTKHYGTGGKIETYEIGEWDIKINRSLFIRIYDKLAEIQENRLQDFYKEYLLEEFVTRFELEFRSDLCKSLPFEKLRDKEYLLGLFIRYIEKHTSIFNELVNVKVDKLKRPQKAFDTKGDGEDKKIIIPERYISSFLGYARNIMKYGECPADILFRHDVIQLSTVQNLNRTMKRGRVSILSYKCNIEGDEIPKMYQRPEFQSHLTDDYNIPLEDLDFPF